MKVLSLKFNKLMKARLTEAEYKEFFDDVMSVTRDAVECSMVDTIDKEADILVKEHFAASWRDDDSPQAEQTFGVCHARDYQLHRPHSIGREEVHLQSTG